MFLVITHKRIPCFMNIHTLQTLVCNILLHGRSHVVGTRVFKDGRHSLVDQDVVGVCHMKTCVNEKVYRHMTLCVYIRNTETSPDKITFSDSWRHKWGGSFAHCEVWTVLQHVCLCRRLWRDVVRTHDCLNSWNHCRHCTCCEFSETCEDVFMYHHVSKISINFRTNWSVTEFFGRYKSFPWKTENLKYEDPNQ
jgi:hypothetical protein